jgi:hypothetical protein
MKKLILVIAFVSAVFGALSANAAQNNGPTVIGKLGFANQYLAFGSGSVLDPDPAMQSLLLVLYPNGWNWSLWNTTNFKKWNSTLGSEVDYGFGWNGKVSEHVTLDAGIIYFDEPKVFKLGAGDIVYGHVYVSRDILGLTGTVGYEKYVTMPNSGFKGGDIWHIGASKKNSFSDNQVTLSNSLALAYDNGGFGFDSGLLLRGIVTVDWKLSKRLTLTAPQLYYYVPLTVHDARKNDLVVYTGVSYTF